MSLYDVAPCLAAEVVSVRKGGSHFGGGGFCLGGSLREAPSSARQRPPCTVKSERYASYLKAGILVESYFH